MALGYSQDIIDDAGTAGSMFGSAIMETMGYENKEKAVDRILKNGDWTTEEGKAEMLAEVGAIDPAAHKELQTQLLEAERTRSLTAQTKLNTDAALVNQKKVLNQGIYTREFERDATINGMEASIKYFLDRNLIEYKDKDKLKTLAQVKTFLTKKKQEGLYSGLVTFVGERQEMYINRRAMEDSGLANTEDYQALSTEMNLAPKTKEIKTEQFVKDQPDFDENASQWNAYWNKVGTQQRLSKQLGSVVSSLIDWFQFEVFLPKDEKAMEDMEDAIMDWLGGGYDTNAAGFQYFYNRSPEELEKFVENPIGYYNENIADIEGSAKFKGVDNTDLFANFDY
jgi:hypothetical protein